MSDNMYILKFLDEAFPDRLPLDYVSDFELGVLVGQQQLISLLKQKLEIAEEKEQEIK